MVTKQDLITAFTKALATLKENSDPIDTPVMALVDEGGYTEGFRTLSHFDLGFADEDDEEGILLVIETEYED